MYQRSGLSFPDVLFPQVRLYSSFTFDTYWPFLSLQDLASSLDCTDTHWAPQSIPLQRGISLRFFFTGRALASFPTCLLKFSAPSSRITHPVPIPANATAIFCQLHPPQARSRFIPPVPVSMVLFLTQKTLALRLWKPAQHLCVPSQRQAPQVSPLCLFSLPEYSPAFSLQMPPHVLPLIHLKSPLVTTVDSPFHLLWSVLWWIKLHSGIWENSCE